MSDNTTVPWRQGRHFPIHVYAQDVPVATFFHPEDAAAAVKAHNQALKPVWTEGPITIAPTVPSPKPDRRDRWFQLIREWEESPGLDGPDADTWDLANRCMALEDEWISKKAISRIKRLTQERDAARTEAHRLSTEYDRIVKGMQEEREQLTAQRDAANDAANNATGPDKFALQEAVRMMWAAIDLPASNKPPVPFEVAPGFPTPPDSYTDQEKRDSLALAYQDYKPEEAK